MNWKIFSVIGMCVALTTPQWAVAAQPPAPADLGQMESILDSCATAKPKDAETYKKQRKKLTEGVPESEVAKIRQSDSYKDAYQTFQERFQQASSEEVDQACNAFAGHK